MLALCLLGPLYMELVWSRVGAPCTFVLPVPGVSACVRCLVECSDARVRPVFLNIKFFKHVPCPPPLSLLSRSPTRMGLFYQSPCSRTCVVVLSAFGCINVLPVLLLLSLAVSSVNGVRSSTCSANVIVACVVCLGGCAVGRACRS